MIECCKSAGVAIAFTRLVDSSSALLGCGRNRSTHQFECNSDDVASPRIGLRISPYELDMVEPVMRS